MTLLLLKPPISPFDPQFNHFTRLNKPLTPSGPIPLSTPTEQDPESPALTQSTSRIVPTLSNLPQEILLHLVGIVIDNRNATSILRVNHQLHSTTLPKLYSNLLISSPLSLERLISTFSKNPALSSHVRSIDLLHPKLDWKYLLKLVDSLGENKERVHTVKVRFPVSDLPIAMEFFSKLSPKSFEWMTSPCWLIRPTNLFNQFLSNWPSLTHLRLSNFKFDLSFADAIISIPTLTHLTLCGHSNASLDPRVISLLVDPASFNGGLKVLKLEHVPRLKREELSLLFTSEAQTPRERQSWDSERSHIGVEKDPKRQRVGSKTNSDSDGGFYLVNSSYSIINTENGIVDDSLCFERKAETISFW